MKISEALEALNSLRKEFGDVNLCFYDNDGRSTSQVNLGKLSVDKVTEEWLFSKRVKLKAPRYVLKLGY